MKPSGRPDGSPGAVKSWFPRQRPAGHQTSHHLLMGRLRTQENTSRASGELATVGG